MLQSPYFAKPMIKYNYDRESKNRVPGMLNKVRNIVMGVLFLTMGVVMIFAEKLGLVNLAIDKTFRNIFAVICFIYGVFRLWRAFKNED